MASAQDILRHLLSLSDSRDRRRYLASVSDAQVEAAAALLFSHIDVHIAEGHRTASDALLSVAEDVADLFDGELFSYLCCRRRARACRKWGDRHGALEAYRKAWKTLEGSDLHEWRVEVLMEMGILMDQGGNRTGALQAFKRAAAICRRERLGFNWAAALFNMASIYLDLGDEEHFMRHAARVSKLDRRFHFPSHRARLELLTANWRDRRSEPEQALEHYRKALTAYRQIQDRLKASEILAHLGEIARSSGLIDAMGPLLGEALAERRAVDAREAEGRHFYYRGLGAWQAGLVVQAARYFQAALERFSGLDGDAEQETRFRLHACLVALGQAREGLPAFLEKHGGLSEPLVSGELPHDPHVGRPHPPLALACDDLGRPEAYRAPHSDGAALTDFHQRRRNRTWIVNRSDLLRLLNALAAWMKLEGRRDLARHLRREARVIDQFLRHLSPGVGRQTGNP